MGALTPAELAAIRAREQAASPGPWLPDETGVGGISPFSAWLGVGPQGDSMGRGFDVALANKDSDAAFIAAARQDVPALLAEVERLREALGAIAGEGCIRQWVAHSDCRAYALAHEGELTRDEWCLPCQAREALGNGHQNAKVATISTNGTETEAGTGTDAERARNEP